MEKKEIINKKKDEEISTYDNIEENEEMENSMDKKVSKILNIFTSISQDLLNEPFVVSNKIKMGDFLLRFYFKQIINVNEILVKNYYYVHFAQDIENILINNNLVRELSNFSLLRKIKETKIVIPGGTQGFFTQELYSNPNESKDQAMIKYNYFDLGLILFGLKYGQDKIFLKYKKTDDKNEKAFQNLDSFLKKNFYINTYDSTGNQKFIDLLNSLMSSLPKNRPSFEEIYGNKWLNEDAEKIEEVVYGFENDDEKKLTIELEKADFFKKENKPMNAMVKIQGRHCKFRYKKKHHLTEIKHN